MPESAVAPRPASQDWPLAPLREPAVAELDAWCWLLEQRSGARLAQGGRARVRSLIAGRLREHGLDDFADYRRQLLAGHFGPGEWALLLQRLTVHETRFFRHPPSFALLRRHMEQRQQQAPARSWALWSVGCASGEEAWSLAICMAELARERPRGLDFGITATDIACDSLAQARRGRYPGVALEGLDAGLRERYFQAADDGSWQVREALARRVCFARANLLEPTGAWLGAMDGVFCQNLLIYLRPGMRQRALQTLSDSLAPGGLLLLGPGEAAGHCPEGLRRIADPDVDAFIRPLAEPASGERS